MTPIADHPNKPDGANPTLADSTGSHPDIDRDAPAGSENSLGAESVRDGRPATKDEVVEAKDELGPNTPD
ncbi:MAG: hypothetical protein V4587_09630 [Acidobacteriota bacterium]